MQKSPEQEFICKVIRTNIHTFVHCKMRMTLCTLQVNYMKEGGDLQTEENTLYTFVH